MRRKNTHGTSRNRAKRWLSAMLCAVAMLTASPVLADEYDEDSAGHPLRLIAYVLYPVGVAIDYLIIPENTLIIKIQVRTQACSQIVQLFGAPAANFFKIAFFHQLIKPYWWTCPCASCEESSRDANHISNSKLLTRPTH